MILIIKQRERVKNMQLFTQKWKHNVEKDDNEPCTKEVHEHLFIEDEEIEQQDNENYLDTNDPEPVEP